MKAPLTFYVTSHPQHKLWERAFLNSLMANSSRDCKVIWLRKNVPGFDWKDWLMYRFAVPELNQHEGLALAVNVPCLFLHDPAEFFSLAPRSRGTMFGCSDIILWKCDDLRVHNIPKASELAAMSGQYPVMAGLHLQGFRRLSAWKWNSFDGKGLADNTRLVSFVDKTTQPWAPFPDAFAYQPHPNVAVSDLFWWYADNDTRHPEEMIHGRSLQCDEVSGPSRDSTRVARD